MYLETFPETGHKKFCNPIRIDYLNLKCMNEPQSISGDRTQKVFFQNSNMISIVTIKLSKARNYHLFIVLYFGWVSNGSQLCLSWISVGPQMCFSCVSVEFQLCLSCVLVVSSLCLSYVSVVSQLCLSCVSVVSQLCLSCVSVVSQLCLS
jgi:hypothetical protein